MDFDGLHESIPNAIARLSTNLHPCSYNLSDMGPGEDLVGEIYHGNCGEEEDMELGWLMSVNNMSLAFF